MNSRKFVSVTDHDANCDYMLEVHLSTTASGDLDGIGNVLLDVGTHWIEKRGMDFRPDSPEDAKVIGTELKRRFEDAIRDKIQRAIENDREAAPYELAERMAG